MSFLDNITDMAKSAMGTVSGATSAATVTTSLSKIAEEIQANPMALVQNPMGMVEKLKELVPMDQLAMAAGAIPMLPFPQDIKDGLTNLVNMAVKTPEVQATIAEETPVMETPEMPAPEMPEVPAPMVEEMPMPAMEEVAPTMPEEPML